MTATTTSLRSLLTRLIDYAGLFPPAKLDMTTTVSNYARYLSGEDSWMLGRLVVPVSRLDEFEEAAQQALRQSAMDDTTPWRISAITSHAGTAELQADLVRIAGFNRKHQDDGMGLAVVDALEMKADSPQAIEAAIDQITGDLFPFFEIPIAGDPGALIVAMEDGDCGAKVRTGGTTAEAYPSPADLARFIHACAAANVPFKATAGMHHPLRHHAEAVAGGVDEHGFLNVFIAASLALTDDLSVQDVQALLEEREIEAFEFEEGGGDAIIWRNHRLRAENIEDVREEFAMSFGSCSFDEPREDLRALGLLGTTSGVR